MLPGADQAETSSKTWANGMTPNAGSDGSSKFEQDLRKKLHDRRWKAQREIEEIDQALESLNKDETVKKVLRVISVANL